MSARRPCLGVLVGSMAIGLAGCASLPTPTDVPHEHAPPVATSPAAPAAVLPASLPDADVAARLALARHPGVRAAQHAWQAQQAEIQQSVRLPNPSVAVARARTRTLHDGDLETAWETEWGVHLPLGAWLAAWLQHDERRTWGLQQQAQAQAQWLQGVDQSARQARRAWVQAVAAQQLLDEAEAAWDAAQTAGELARRLQAVGNFSALQALRWEQAQAQQQLLMAQAQEQAQATRLQLAQALGLWRPADLAALALPTQLPPVPDSAPAPLDEAQAVTQRLDLRAARAAQAQQLARLGVANAERWLASVALGLEAGTEREPGTVARMRRVDLAWDLPLFDRGEARVTAARERAEQAAWQLQDAAQTVRAQVRQADLALQHAWDRARHHQQTLLPLAQRISDEMLLRWNGMFSGPFELLQDAQARLAARRAAVEAQRDYWLAWERARQVRWSPPEGAAASGLPAAKSMAPAADPH